MPKNSSYRLYLESQKSAEEADRAAQDAGFSPQCVSWTFLI